MTRIQRENEVYRLVVAHPGWTTAQLEAALRLPAGQVASAILVLRHRAAIEEVSGGWRRRRSDVHVYRREVTCG